MTNKDILTMFQGLNNLRKRAELRLSALTAFSIVYNLKILQPIAESIEEIRLQILQKYGTQNENGFTIEKEYIEQANKELIELGNIDNNIQLKKISINDINNNNFTLDDMEALYFMLEES